MFDHNWIVIENAFNGWIFGSIVIASIIGYIFYFLNMQSVFSKMFDENYEINNWIDKEDMGSACCLPSSSTTADAAETTSTNIEPLGRLLIFVNPNSGSGIGKKVFERKVRPRLRKANIEYELIMTNGPNHAREVVSSRNDLLSEFCGILILSGDGLVYEILNGLFQRKDRFSVIPQLAIGLIPTGSGNGLLASILASKKYPLSRKAMLISALDVTCSGSAIAHPISLFHVQTPAVNIFSFLSIGWGLLADIDIESERWRKTLGSSRFFFGAVIRSLNLRNYRGRLTYLPHKRSDKFAKLSAFPVYGRNRKSSGLESEMTSLISSSEDRRVFGESRELDDECSRIRVHDVPKLEENLRQDDGWITIDSDFVMVYALTRSHISGDGPYMTRAQLDDDVIYLTYIESKNVAHRLQIVRWLLAIEENKHLDFEFCKCVPVSAFRLESLSGGIIAVDGEAVPCSRIQVSSTTLKTAFFSPSQEFNQNSSD